MPSRAEPRLPANRSPAQLDSAVRSIRPHLDLIQTISVLTLVSAIIFQFDHWLFRIVSGICFLIFALRPSALRRPQFWFALALAGTITIILAWEQVDNHKYLLVYWTWVLFIVHLLTQPDQQKRILRFNARFFLCLIFLSCFSPEALFAQLSIGRDVRALPLCRSTFRCVWKTHRHSSEVGDAVTRQMHFLRSPFADVDGNDIHVQGSDRARMAAVAMTWWDLGLQLTIGALLLIRKPRTDELHTFSFSFLSSPPISRRRCLGLAGSWALWVSLWRRISFPESRPPTSSAFSRSSFINCRGEIGC